MSANKEFTKQFRKKSITEACYSYLSFDVARGIDNIGYNAFMKSLDENIEVIYRKVNSGDYTFSPYKEKLIVKSKLSYPRVISIPTVRDKVVLKLLQFILKEVYSEINAKLPQVYIQELKDNIHKFDYFIKLDISNFFGSISHGILLDKLSKKIKSDKIANLIKNAITNPTIIGGAIKKEYNRETRGVPQGIPISNILAQIYLQDIDKKYESRNDIKYIRYVDDILILCQKKDYIKISSEIQYELEGILNLKINREKTVMNEISYDNNFAFLGYKYGVLKNGKMGLTVKEENKAKFENSLVSIFMKYINDDKVSPEQLIFTLNNKITGSISKKVDEKNDREYKYGWLFYFSQIDDIGLLFHFDNLIQKFLGKYEKCKSIDRSEIKYFVKAFFEIRYNIKNTDYIHKPDTLSINQKKEILVRVFKISEIRLSSNEIIDKLYYKFVYKPIKTYQKDIQKLIS